MNPGKRVKKLEKYALVLKGNVPPEVAEELRVGEYIAVVYDTEFVVKVPSGYVYINSEDGEAFFAETLEVLVEKLLDLQTPADCAMFGGLCRAFEDTIERLRNGEIKVKLVPWEEVA